MCLLRAISDRLVTPGISFYDEVPLKKPRGTTCDPGAELMGLGNAFRVSVVLKHLESFLLGKSDAEPCV